MDDFDGACRFESACRKKHAKRYERKFGLREKTSEISRIVEELFEDETHLTKEMVLDELKKHGYVRKFEGVMKFLCKEKRILRGI